jgi:hypothetical protein
MAKLQFSIGSVEYGSTSLGFLTNITVSYDGDPQEFRGADYNYPVQIELGNRTVEITAESGRLDGDLTDTWLTSGAPVNIVFSQSSNNNGLAGTITNVKCVSHEVAQAQKEFVTYSMTFQMQEIDES